MKKMADKISRDYARMFELQQMAQEHMVKIRQLKKLVGKITLYCNEEADLPQALRFLRRMRYDMVAVCERGGHLAQAMAAYLVYIIDVELEVLDLKLNHSRYAVKIPKPLKWTGTHVALVCLGYALKKFLNRGKAQMQEIMDCFEFVFQARPGNYSKTLEEAGRNSRKAALFFDGLKENLMDILKKK